MTVSIAGTGRRCFADVTALDTRGPGTFAAEIDPEWTIAGKPNGGYLLAVLGRAAARTADHHQVLAASAHYLRSPNPGPVTVAAEVLRAGRSASQVRAWMGQDGRPCVEALITVSNLPPDTRPYWEGGMPHMSEVPVEECLRLQPVLPDGNRVALLEQIDVRLEPDTLGFTRGMPSGRGELRGWLALPGDDSFDSTSLLFALDSLPPASFDIEYSGWVPTLELTGYIRGIPAPGPLRVLQRAQLIAAGHLDEACFVWDSHGHLVAQGTQLAGIRAGRSAEAASH
jgi:hypothetical protein